MPLADGCLTPSGDRWGGKIGVVSPKDTRADCATAGLRRVSRGGRRASARVGRRPDLESWREVAEGRRRASVYRAGPPRIHVRGRPSSDLEKISKCWAGAGARRSAAVGRRAQATAASESPRRAGRDEPCAAAVRPTVAVRPAGARGQTWRVGARWQGVGGGRASTGTDPCVYMYAAA